VNDPIIDFVARLPPAAVAPDRARRTQARCHRALARRAARRRVPTPRRARVWSRATVAVAMFYLAEAVRQAASLFAAR
jgi:hypothetical protein